MPIEEWESRPFPTTKNNAGTFAGKWTQLEINIGEGARPSRVPPSCMLAEAIVRLQEDLTSLVENPIGNDSPLVQEPKVRVS